MAIRSRGQGRGKPLKALVAFFLIFIPVTGFFEYAVVNWNYGNWIIGMMWSVGLSAVLALLVIGRPLASLGWGWGKTKYQLAALVIPILYAGLSCGFVWATGLAKYDPTYAENFVGNRLGMAFAPLALTPIVLILAIGFMSLPSAITSALGEEIGWRGFLAPELAKLMPFLAAAVVTGIIWGLWHFPILFGGDYNPATGMSAFDAVKFLTATVLASIPMTYLRLRSGSVWTAAIFHGSHNLFLNNVFAPMVAKGEGKDLVGELGLATFAFMAVFAIIAWMRARKNLGGE